MRPHSVRGIVRQGSVPCQFRAGLPGTREGAKVVRRIRSTGFLARDSDVAAEGQRDMMA